jgi:Domain of unknown function (DUF6438)
MTMKLSALLLAAAICAGPAAAQSPSRAAPESITYRAGPCFGRCPIYEVTVRSDGRGTFNGINFTAVRGIRAFRVTPAQYLAFKRHLAPIRPAQGSVDYNGERCRNIATDMPSADVTWRGRAGEQRLHFYYGCDPEGNRALARRLNAAPGLLPLTALIGVNR